MDVVSQDSFTSTVFTVMIRRRLFAVPSLMDFKACFAVEAFINDHREHEGCSSPLCHSESTVTSFTSVSSLSVIRE